MFLKAKEHQHKLTFGSYVWSIRKLEKKRPENRLGYTRHNDLTIGKNRFDFFVQSNSIWTQIKHNSVYRPQNDILDPFWTSRNNGYKIEKNVFSPSKLIKNEFFPFPELKLKVFSQTVAKLSAYTQFQALSKHISEAKKFMEDNGRLPTMIS